jgi:hypothetical protein
LLSQIENLRLLITSSLSTLFEKEMENGKDKILDLVSPLSQYIQRENSRLDSVRNEFSDIAVDIVQIEESIQIAFPHKTNTN